MELQPGAYAIKKHIPGQFMAIETVAAPQNGAGDVATHANQPPSLAEGQPGGGGYGRGRGGGGELGAHLSRGAGENA